MATKKRLTGTKKRGPAARGKGVLGRAFSREVVGAFLLVAGLFFTAAFLTGRGAFLGEAGLAIATRLTGVVGLALAPLALLAGSLLLLGRLPRKRTLGVALLLLCGAMTLAATLPPELRFDATAAAARGGLLGSGLYAAVHHAGGSVGAAFALGFLYAAGLSLLTGVTLGATTRVAGDAANSLYRRLAPMLREKRRQVAKGPRHEGTRHQMAVPEEATPEHSVLSEDTFGEALEVVLPERREHLGFEEGQEQSMSGEYTPPPVSLLDLGRGEPEHDAEETSRRLTRALAELGVEAHVVRAVVGPRVTRYELRLGSGVKVGKVRNLQQDIAYALAATEIRILAPIPGKSAVGVEVPNTKAATVTLGDVFQEYPDANDWSLPVGLGKDISGRAVFLDLAEMPHLLVAGTTGSGKSVMLNGLLTSLLLTTDPRQVKMVLIDPKRVEFSQFARVPHLITPIVTDVKKAANALSWAVSEMERRYEVLERFGVRSLEGYSELRSEKPIPYVVIVIDELADLMINAAAKVEDAVIRLAQKARAVGIHLVVATQRPSVDVITGMIKANVPSRVAFAVSSQIDSRVILDSVGAEALLGQGDMLFKPVSALRPSRVQGAYISEEEVRRVVSACASRAAPSYVEGVTEAQEHAEGPEENEEPVDDALLPEAASFVVATQQASVSAVQRRFRVGYSRAGRIIDALERRGIVGPYEGSKSRQVVATELDLTRIFDGGGSEGQSADAPKDPLGGT